jgi:hypothetical protein
MNLWPSERIFVLAAAIVATVSLAAFGGRETSVRSVMDLPGGVIGAGYEPETTGVIATERQDTWGNPPALPRGDEWVYEVFTPPEIYYNAEARRFWVAGETVNSGIDRASESTKFGIELVAIEAVDFPLQLVGYIGGPETYLGVFVNVETAETFLGNMGLRVPELGIIIEKFGVVRKAVALGESMTVTEFVAEATVRHEITGEETVLDDRTRTLSGIRRVVLRSTQGKGANWVAGEGEVLQIADVLYRIEKIRLAPASATISKESAGATVSERRTLYPPVSVSGHLQ